MTPTAAILLVIAASLHASWNFVGKRENPSAAFFTLANIIGAFSLTPLLFFQWEMLLTIPSKIWILLVMTSLCQSLYYLSLAGAYRSGDLSVVYPLARSSPVIVVTVVTIFLGRKSEVGDLCIVGIFFVVAGCFFLPMKNFSDFRIKNYLHVSCLLALLAAFGTTGYSIIDDESLRMLRKGLSKTQALGVTGLYCCLQGLITSIIMPLCILFQHREVSSIKRIWEQSRKHAVFTGISSYWGYSLVLVAMGFVSNVSYVVAFRQLSIPIGAILGITILKEPPYRPKFFGILMIFVGLVLVGIG
jgi:drug/metabolite transporter (DMT)-like permease